MSAIAFQGRRFAAAVSVVAALLVVGCSGSAAPAAPSVDPGTSAAPVGVASAAPGGAASAAPVQSDGATTGDIDPCKVLTIADVQPFFLVAIATELPGPKELGDTCEWAANDGPGGVSTSLDLNVVTGQDALDSWSIADAPGPETKFSGVGDQAEHYPGSPDFVSIKGSILCKISTVGATHLVGKSAYQPGDIPDPAATAIAQNFGTLCNKIYGSGQTAPLQTGPPIAAASAPAPTASVAIPAIGGTFGSAFPLPQGLDCTGANLSTDPGGSTVCTAMFPGDQYAVYPFYLSTLPAKGFTITHESEESSNGKEIASILFEGPGAGGFSSMDVLGQTVTITLTTP